MTGDTADSLDEFHPLRGKIAAITGAGQGLGRTLALGLAAGGARHVVVTDINVSNGQQTVKDIKAAGGEASFYDLDVTDATGCRTVADRIADQVGAVAVLVNNAGILSRDDIDSEQAPQWWRQTVDVNLNGVFNVSHAFLPALKATGGAIVNISSMASYFGHPGVGYSPSKAGVRPARPSPSTAATSAHKGRVLIRVGRA